jgi:aminopeptidase-like protein
MMNLLAYADGAHDLLAIAERIDAPIGTCAALAERLVDAGVLRLA